MLTSTKSLMEKFMRRAFALARKTNPFPNPRVGAVLVRDGKVIGEGHHRKAGMPHAEIEAIKDALARGEDVKGAVLYVTLEPCSHRIKRTPPCTDAIIKAGIAKVVFAMRDPNPLVSGSSVLRGAGLKTKGPTDQPSAERINKRYIRHMAQKPFVAIKMAMSADGKTATRTGDSKWISCPESRKEVMRMRSRFDAVIVGAGTVRADDPRLTARIGSGRNPYRVIVDGRLSIPRNSKILKNDDGKTLVAVSGKAPEGKCEGLNTVVCGNDKVDMGKLVQGLGAMGMKRILIEGGSELNASALESGVVDMLYLFISPKIIGGVDAKGVVGGKGFQKVNGALKIRKMRSRKVGEDLLLECWL